MRKLIFANPESWLKKMSFKQLLSRGVNQLNRFIAFVSRHEELELWYFLFNKKYIVKIILKI